MRFPRCTAKSTKKFNVSYYCSSGPWAGESIKLATASTFTFSVANYKGKYVRDSKHPSNVKFEGEYIPYKHGIKAGDVINPDSALIVGDGMDSPRMVVASREDRLVITTVIKDTIVPGDGPCTTIAWCYREDDPKKQEITLWARDIGITFNIE